jgi:cell division protease FtsH
MMDISRGIPDPNLTRRSDNVFFKSIAFLMTLGLLFCFLYLVFHQQSSPVRETSVAFSYFLDQLEAGAVTEVTFQGHSLHYRTLHGDRMRTYTPSDPDLIKLLRAKRVKIMAEPEESNPSWRVILTQWFPILFLIALWIVLSQKWRASQKR